MSVARRHRVQHVITTWARRAGNFLRISDEVVAPLLDIIRRPAIAQAFFLSALVKLSDWDNALYLAEHEYPVSWMNHVTAAHLGVSIEIVGAVLLSLGLMTRFAAFALLILTIIMQYAYEPINAQVFWIIILGHWVIMGGGLKSIDFLLRGLRDSALPFAASFSQLFAWLRRAVGPWYFLFIRLWIASVLYVAGHTAMESMPLHAGLQFLQYQPQLSVLRVSEPSFWLSLVCGIGAISLALGLATRVWALMALMVIGGSAMQQLQASEVQMAEFFYWIMLLSILFFSGPNRISMDHLIRRSLGRLFPEFSGEFPVIHDTMPHVVIVGGGFGGIAAAKMLRTTACRVTLIDKHNYHLFQPLLYQVATASLSPSDIATPIRSLFREQQNIRVVLGEVTGIHASKHEVVCEDKRFHYDYLILATGARHSYFGKDDWAAFAPGMKRVEDAIAVRGKLLKAFELAENASDMARREALLTFVIVGGGPTGVELAGALAELAHQGMGQEFRNIDPSKARIYLVEAGARLLGVMPDTVSAYTQRALEKLGVTVLTGARVQAIDAEGVLVNDTRITSSNVIWAAGVQASPAAKWLDAPADRVGRIKVHTDLSVVGHERIYAIGDTAWAEVWKGKPMPGLAPAAKQSGQFVARHIRARIEGSPTPEAFAYRHYGSLATIGRKAAVADFGRVRVKGALAWWFWGLVHIAFLSNMQSRIAVMIKWFWAYLTFRRSTRLITETIH